MRQKTRVEQMVVDPPPDFFHLLTDYHQRAFIASNKTQFGLCLVLQSITMQWWFDDANRIEGNSVDEQVKTDLKRKDFDKDA